MNELLLVLGCGILESKRRAKYTRSLVYEKPIIPIILTGGLSRRIPFLQPNPEMSEARYMRQVLGVKNPTYLEEEANNTAQNLLYSRRLIERTLKLQGIKEINIVDGKFHMKRTLYLASIILKDYYTTGLPVPIILNGSSLLEKLIGVTMETLSSILEISARKKNEKALAAWQEQGNTRENFPGVSMFYNRPQD